MEKGKKEDKMAGYVIYIYINNIFFFIPFVSFFGILYFYLYFSLEK